MNNDCFAFWLQGFFEILDAENLKLTEKQIKCVQSHLDLTREIEGELGEFQAWLSGFLDGKQETNIEETHKIRTRLNSHFKHVIDPKFESEGMKGKLQKLHDAFKPQSPDFINMTPLRC